MNEGKIELIKKSLDGFGLKLGGVYSNKEMVDGSIKLQGAIARDFATRMQIDIDKDRDVLLAIEKVITKNNLDDTEEFQRLKKNITELGYTIGSFIKGMNGERIAKRVLKLIAFDKDVRVLFNIALEDEDVQAEYDAIVIAPYGIFVVEVKNWDAPIVINERGVLQKEDGTDIIYDLPGRMGMKEGLLREYLGDLFTTDYQGIVFFSNERAKVRDEYKKIPLSFGGSIVYDIRAYSKDKPFMSKEQIDKIADRLLANSKEQKTINKIDSEAIIDDYATLIVMLEEVAESKSKTESKIGRTAESVNDSMAEKDCKEKYSVMRTELQNEFVWWSAASAASIMIVTSLGAFVARKVWRM